MTMSVRVNQPGPTEARRRFRRSKAGSAEGRTIARRLRGSTGDPTRQRRARWPSRNALVPFLVPPLPSLTPAVVTRFARSSQLRPACRFDLPSRPPRHVRKRTALGTRIRDASLPTSAKVTALFGPSTQLRSTVGTARFPPCTPGSEIRELRTARSRCAAPRMVCLPAVPSGLGTGLLRHSALAVSANSATASTAPAIAHERQSFLDAALRSICLTIA